MTTDSSVLEDQIRDAFQFRADSLPKRDPLLPALPVVEARRRSPRSVGLVVAILVIALVVAVVAVVRATTTDTRPADRPTVTTTVNRDLGAAVPQQSLNGIRTIRGGRGLRIFFTGGAPFAPGNPCSVRYHASHTETRTAVHVRLVGDDPEPGVFCYAIGYGRQTAIALSAPLEGRQVTVNGARQPVFDGAHLVRPSWIPHGYQVRDYPGLSGTSWTRTWSPPVLPPTDDRCTPTAMGLQLTQGPDTPTRRQALARDLVASDQQLQEHPRIGDATADYYASIHQQTLTWNHDHQNYIVMTVPPCGSYTLMPLADILRFARSVRTPR